jgi:hypothetical protein
MPGIEMPTKIRFMNRTEYGIVTRVMGDTLPYRRRILITDACGVDGRAFTIPTSLLSTILGVPATGFFGGVALGYLSSFTNLAYLINVGSANYDQLDGTNKKLLVHETMHVWQGKNSTFALSYVFNSVISQCFSGQGAYNYVLGQSWSSYNVEQQAKIVEDWFFAGESSSHSAYTYIENNVRKGDA